MNRETLELSAPYAAPSSEAETKMVACWAEAFGVDRVGLDDDYFELGGDSLLAATLVASLRSSFDAEFRESQLADLCTPRKLLSSLGATAVARREALPSNVTAVNPEGRRAPIFMIHGAAGLTFLKPRFRAALDPDQPIYIFQAQGYDGAAPPLASVEEIASAYLRSILQVQPEPPWNLVAFCAGGWIAVEIVKQMQQQGRQPANVILVDTNLPSRMRKDYSLKRMRLGNVRLPVVPDFAVSLIQGVLALARRIKFFASTGRFKDGYDPKAFDDPAIRDRLIASSRRRNKKRAVSRSEASTDDATEAGELAGVYSSEAAAVTSATLRHAYRSYVPSPSDFPFTFIVSVKRSNSSGDPEYPVNRLLPNRRVVISGDNHGDAVSSPETAELIQRIVDGAPIAAAVAEPPRPAVRETQPAAG